MYTAEVMGTTVNAIIGLVIHGIKLAAQAHTICGLLWVMLVGVFMEKSCRVPVLENPGGSRVYVLGIEEEFWLFGWNVRYTTTELIFWTLTLIYALNSVETVVHYFGTENKDLAVNIPVY